MSRHSRGVYELNDSASEDAFDATPQLVRNMAQTWNNNGRIMKKEIMKKAVQKILICVSTWLDMREWCFCT